MDRIRQSRVSGLLALLLIVMGIGLILGAVASGTRSAPSGGNQDCPSGTAELAKFDVGGSTYTFSEPSGNQGIVTITNPSPTGGDWSSQVAVAAIVVKGGPASVVVTIDPPALSGTFDNTGLPLVGSGQLPAISNIKFCNDTNTPVTTTAPASPTTTAPASPTTTAPASPTTTAPASPTTTTPASPTTTAPASPTTTAPASPTTTAPASPTTTAPASPTTTAPASPTTTSPASPTTTAPPGSPTTTAPPSSSSTVPGSSTTDPGATTTDPGVVPPTIGVGSDGTPAPTTAPPKDPGAANNAGSSKHATNTGSAAATTATGPLAFTGIQAVAMVIVGAALVIAGLFLAWVAPRRRGRA